MNSFVRAHPRSRGDHYFTLSSSAKKAGSSPLARGPLSCKSISIHGFGLIPARAGTTPPQHETAEPARAHPRSRGDHIDEGTGDYRITGSSPLARGPLVKVAQEALNAGLIPARAGTTSLSREYSVMGWAHPRSRGDHRIQLTISTLLTGSSPLARGPLAWRKCWPVGAGLIPARAGTTCAVMSH